jgi:hypothetical protein
MVFLNVREINDKLTINVREINDKHLIYSTRIGQPARSYAVEYFDFSIKSYSQKENV